MRLRDATKDLYAHNGINTSLLDAKRFKFGQVFDAAGHDGVDITETAFFDCFSQRIVEFGIGFDAVDFGDFGFVVAVELVSASGADFDDGARGLCDEGGESCFELFLECDCICTGSRGGELSEVWIQRQIFNFCVPGKVERNGVILTYLKPQFAKGSITEFFTVEEVFGTDSQGDEIEEDKEHACNKVLLSMSNRV